MKLLLKLLIKFMVVSLIPGSWSRRRWPACTAMMVWFWMEGGNLLTRSCVPGSWPRRRLPACTALMVWFWMEEGNLLTRSCVPSSDEPPRLLLHNTTMISMRAAGFQIL